MDFAAWIATTINVVLVVLLFVGKRWIETSVEKSVEHRFNAKLETTKSELRTYEAEWTALRDMVLSGTAQRLALLDRRRIEAVERIWAATNRLAPFAAASASMARINFDAAAKRTPHEANLRQVFEVIAPSKLVEELKRDQPTPAINEQPFISPLAWAYFSAYQSIILGAFMAARTLAEGVADAGKLLKRDHARELLKATLPHQAEYIDGNDPAAYHHLLEELKELLLTELRNILDGQASDREAINRGNEITGVLRKIEAENAERRAGNPKVREALTEIDKARGA